MPHPVTHISLMPYPWNTKSLPAGHNIRHIHEGYTLTVRHDDHPELPYFSEVTNPDGNVVHVSGHKFLADARRAAMSVVLAAELNRVRRSYNSTNRQFGV